MNISFTQKLGGDRGSALRSGNAVRRWHPAELTVFRMCWRPLLRRLGRHPRVLEDRVEHDRGDRLYATGNQHQVAKRDVRPDLDHDCCHNPSHLQRAAPQDRMPPLPRDMGPERTDQHLRRHPRLDQLAPTPRLEPEAPLPPTGGRGFLLEFPR